MKAYSREDSELTNYRDEISPYTTSADSIGVPYWIFIHEENVVGMVIIGQEPIQLIEPVGTPMSIIRIINFNLPIDVLRNFASKALKKAQEQGAHYSFIDLSSKNEDLIEHFLKIGYTSLAHSHRMFRSIEDFEEKSILKAEQVEREDARNLLEKMIDFMSGSPDVMLNTILGNIKELPDKILDFWFNSELLYRIYAENELVGFLDLNPQSRINIANMGISPKHRRKGYGHELLNLALTILKEKGVKKARLRVHVNNIPAIKLYKSFGFEVSDTYSALIWRK